MKEDCPNTYKDYLYHIVKRRGSLTLVIFNNQFNGRGMHYTMVINLAPTTITKKCTDKGKVIIKYKRMEVILFLEGNIEGSNKQQKFLW